MKIKIFILLLFLLIFIKAWAQDNSNYLVELLVEPQNGNIIWGVDERRVKDVWAEMLIRGTTGLKNIPFDPGLFAKYYTRYVIKVGLNVPVAVNAYVNFRKHQKQPGILKAWDEPKFKPLSSEQMWADIQNSGILSYVPEDSLSGLPLWARWPWGIKEWEKFVIFEIDSVEASSIDSIQAIQITVGEKKLRGWQAFKVNMNLVIKALQWDEPLYSIITKENLPDPAKNWLGKYFKSENKYKNLTIIDAIRDSSISNEFLKYKRNKIKLDWLQLR